MKLDVKAAGLSMGIIWSFAILFSGISSMLWGWGSKFVEVFGSFYIGYDATLLGSLIGGLWGFVDGGVFGLVIAWLYNKLSKQ